MKLLGVAKPLGIAAILHGGFPRLKEWAYAALIAALPAGPAPHELVAASAAVTES